MAGPNQLVHINRVVFFMCNFGYFLNSHKKKCFDNSDMLMVSWCMQYAMLN